MCIRDRNNVNKKINKYYYYYFFFLRSSVVESVEVNESPVAPPRTRKSISLSQSSLASVSGVSTNENIPAATAIAGGIPANHELPYMTPPLPNTSGPPTQQHFSGDSQDSSSKYCFKYM